MKKNSCDVIVCAIGSITLGILIAISGWISLCGALKLYRLDVPRIMHQVEVLEVCQREVKSGTAEDFSTCVQSQGYLVW